MVFFNYALRKLNAKIVYYGPGLCGKTTNLAWIHDNFEGGERGKMISLATEGDRTIFFDLLPIEIGSVRGMDVTLQLYTVPGQVHYNSTRQLVLRGADGVVFVADSQRAMQSSNTESFSNLQENLLLQGIALDGFPLALQFNKRDLKDTLSVEELNENLNLYKVPIFEAVATEGMGVQETLEGIVKLVMRSLRERYEGAAAGPITPGVADPSARQPFTPPSPPTVAPGPVAVEPPKAPVAPEPPPPIEVKLPPVEPPPVADTPRYVPPELPDYVDPPKPGELVFATDEGAQTTDFSKTVGQEVFGGGNAGTGFEDEVSTAVYDVGDEVEFDPGNVSGESAFSEPPLASTPEPPLAGGEPTPPIFEDEPTNTALGAEPDHGFATGGGGGVPETLEGAPEPESGPVPDDFDIPPAPPSEMAPEPDIATSSIGEEEPEIEFLPADDGDDTVPPTADLPPPSDRYVDRIVAPSPFAPRPAAASSETTPDLPVDEVAAAITDDVLRAFDAEEDEAALASAVDEQEEVEIEVTVEPDLESDQTVPFAPSPQPVMVMGEEDPFGVEEEIPATLEQPAAIEPAAASGVDLRAEDNKLHLRLQGTGAIIESGQVRELDIEVPVPGAWVGHRRVTLQLRLTLTPDTEDEDGGNSPS